jgi:hypothetical protein
MDLVRSLRLSGKNYEAWAALQPINADTAECAYERSILSYYVGVPKGEALLDFVRSYSRFKNTDYGNLVFYVQPFQSTVIPFPVAPIDDFLPTSTSILAVGNHFLLNVRYVNYRIQENGSYLMSERGVLSPHHHLRTRNFFCRTNDFRAFTPLQEITPDLPPIHDRHIHGIEDIRLFRKGGTIYFSGTTCEYSHNGLIQEIQGVYDSEAKHLTHLSPMFSPYNHHVEKNWIPFNRAYEDDSRFIYSWHPLTIGRVVGGHFHKEVTVDTPHIFSHVRGSSTLVFSKGFLYTMVHCVIETIPRKYYHMLVRLDPVTYEVGYTVPYYFVKNHIEYTLGIHIADGQLTAIASQNDCDPIIARIPMDSLLWV